MTSPLVGWQNGDATRGTFSIIKTCVVTMFACTWTIQHLNVPAAHDGIGRRHLRICKWMLVTILLPEFILAKAILELVLAVRCMGLMKQAIDCDPAKREMIRLKYPAWMGMLSGSPGRRWPAIRSRLGPTKPVDSLGREEEAQVEPSSSRTSQVTEHPSCAVLTWTITHAYFANMGGFVATPPMDELPKQPEPEVRYPLTGIQLAMSLDLFDYPDITEDEIKDKSKTDGLAKVFSVFQISHLVLSLIVRRAQGLPSSQLEILTLAFAVCGVATYAIYWYKPKDIAVPVRVSVGASVDETRLARHAPAASFDSFWRVVTNHPDQDQTTRHRIPNDNIPVNDTGFAYTATFLLAFVSAVFSSLHAIAWGFDFPTAAEETIWHVCTILTITLPPLGLLGIPLSQATWRQGNPRDFLYASVRVLRELSWQLDNWEERREADRVRRVLERIHDSDLGSSRSSRANQHLYRDLLGPQASAGGSGPAFRQKMLDFVDKKEPFQARPDLDLPPRYALHLHQLSRLVDGHGSKKMIEKIARTNVFPRRGLPTAFNIGLVYATMGSYCVARLALIAVGMSSFRAMPQPVYHATWADYIPAI